MNRQTIAEWLIFRYGFTQGWASLISVLIQVIGIVVLATVAFFTVKYRLK